MSSLELLNKGKVRDIYKIDDDRLLIVTTDRLSALNRCLTDVIEGKGSILNEMSNEWFRRTEHIIPNHILNTNPMCDPSVYEAIKSDKDIELIRNNSVIVKYLKPLPIEAIVRGYITGTFWQHYKENNYAFGIKLEESLEHGQELRNPIYTPTHKTEDDAPMTFEDSVGLLGSEVASQIRDVSLQLYTFARDFAQEKGITIADTKFEFGLDKDNKLHLMDELLTPDSSRFWNPKDYSVGSENIPSFDKELIRNFIKHNPNSELPVEALTETYNRYKQAYYMLFSDVNYKGIL